MLNQLKAIHSCYISKTFFSFALMFCLLAKLAGAEAAAPQNSLESFIETLRTMDFSREAKVMQSGLAEKANGFLDLESLGKRALSDHWAKAAPEQQTQFLTLLWKLIEKKAYKQSHDFLANLTITYPEATRDETGFKIKSIVRQEVEGIDTEVLYHLTQIDGQWKIDDVILDGVSIVEDLKYQFDKIIAKSQFSGLLETMQKRLEDTEIQNQPAAA